MSKRILLLLAILTLSLAASATTVDMQFNGAVGGSYNGVYTYPYNVSVDGQDQLLMCVGFNEHIVDGETWKASVESIVGTHDQELAWLFLQAEQTSDFGVKAEINAAAWALNEGSPELDEAAQFWLSQATSQSFTDGEFQNVVKYMPIDGTQSWQGEMPQEFLGDAPVPEPSTLMMLGTGVLGVAGFVRRKFDA
jgi:PEP-CTERM motif